MSYSFIKQQNQELLWRIINQTPQMQVFFNGAQPGARETWFQQVIQHIYSKSLNNNASLKDLNKDAIQLMLDLLQMAEAQQRPEVQQRPEAQQRPDAQQRPIMSNRPVQPQTTNDLYESRLKEYEQNNKPPEQPLQLTPFKDEAIQDLGSAVNEYIKSRESNIALPPPSSQQQKKSVSWEDDNPLLLKILNKLSVLEDKIDNLQKELKNTNVTTDADSS